MAQTLFYWKVLQKRSVSVTEIKWRMERQRVYGGRGGTLMAVCSIRFCQLYPNGVNCMLTGTLQCCPFNELFNRSLTPVPTMNVRTTGRSYVSVRVFDHPNQLMEASTGSWTLFILVPTGPPWTPIIHKTQPQIFLGKKSRPSYKNGYITIFISLPLVHTAPYCSDFCFLIFLGLQMGAYKQIALRYKL